MTPELLDLSLDVALMSVGIAVLYFGAEWMVRGAARLAGSLGVSPIVVGLTIVSFGTSAPELVVSNGGLDANWLNAKGIPTVTLGAGQHNPHTIDEYVDLPEFFGGCRLAIALATE